MIENGVTNYPRKGKKAAQRAETSLVYILKCKSSNKYCLAQRPDTGLLANLLEFPSVALPNWSEDSTMTITSVLKNLNEHYNLKATTKQVSKEPNTLIPRPVYLISVSKLTNVYSCMTLFYSIGTAAGQSFTYFFTYKANLFGL